MIKRLFIAFAMLTAVVAGVSAQVDSNGSINRLKEGWLHHGYRGSVWGGAGTSFEVYTSHGFQLNNWAYIGVGIGCYSPTEITKMSITLPISNFSAAVFANPQLSLPTKSRFSPYLDMQIGLNFGDETGLHLSPAIGCRFAIAKKWGINLSLAYTLKKIQYTIYINNDNRHHNFSAVSNIFTIRLGVDFNL